MLAPALLSSTAPFLMKLHFAHRILLLLHPLTTYMQGLYFKRGLPYSKFLLLFLSMCNELLVGTLSLTWLFFCFTIIFRLNVTLSFWIRRTFATLFLSTRITPDTKMQMTWQYCAKISWLCGSSDRRYVIKFWFRSTVWKVKCYPFCSVDRQSGQDLRSATISTVRHRCCYTATVHCCMLLLLDALLLQRHQTYHACNLQLATGI